MANWTNQAKSAAPTFTNEVKNPSGVTFGMLPMSILENISFQDAVLSDGTKLEDVTFDTLVPSTLFSAYIKILWTNKEKSATPTYTNEPKH